MSAQQVRDAFRAAWGQFAPGVPYVDALNIAPDTPQGPFGTLAFEAADRRDASMGSQPWVTEEGTVTVSIFSRSGAGDAAALAIARQAVEWLMAQNLGEDLWVTSVAGPNDSPEAAGEFWEQVISVGYSWQGREAR
jgi:hypothetical protein